MSTYTDLQTRIADELARTDLTSQIQLAILSAVKSHERRTFYFNTTTSTLSTVASQEYYASAALSAIPDILTIHGMTIDLGTSQKVPVDPAPWEEIDTLQTGSITGDPTLYAYFKQQIRFYPIPNAVRTVTLGYTYKLTALSSGSDTNAWTNDAEELIRMRAKADLLTNVIRPDSDQEIIRFRQREAEVLSELMRETKMRRMPVLLGTEIPSRGSYNIYADR